MQKNEQTIAKLNACIANKIKEDEKYQELISVITIDLSGDLTIITSTNEPIHGYSYNNFSMSITEIAKIIVHNVHVLLKPAKPKKTNSQLALPSLFALSTVLGVNIKDYL